MIPQNQCAACERPILDRFLLNVLDRTWHARCVQCADCAANLNEKCFVKEGKLYCKRDYIRRFGPKCAGCGLGISPSDLVRRNSQGVFHLKCFTCMHCRKQLSTGEELVMQSDGRFICKEDYLKSVQGLSDNEDEDLELDSTINDRASVTSDKDVFDDECLSRDGSMSELQLQVPGAHDMSCPVSPGGTAQQSASSPRDSSNNNNNNNTNSNKENVGDDANNNGGSGETKTEGMGAKRRGPRTTIKAKQLETLKAAFAATPKPTRHIREQLAQETGLNMRVIQVWFQNRRSKERRMKQLSALGARRHFFRNPRRMRALRAGMSPHDMDDNPDVMGGAPFGYFPGQGEFYPNFQGYNEFFHGNPDHPHMPFGMPPGAMEPGMEPGQFGMPPHGDLPPPHGVQPSPSPEPNMAVMGPADHFSPRGQFPGMVGPPGHPGGHGPPPDMPVDNW